MLRPVAIPGQTTLSPHLVHPGLLISERLVNMAKHQYKLEPNVTFTPDQKRVIFRSHMFGQDYVFGVEVAKAPAPPP